MDEAFSTVSLSVTKLEIDYFMTTNHTTDTQHRIALLRWTYFITVCLVLLIPLMFMFLHIERPLLTPTPSTAYLLDMSAIALTICCIPVALRLMKFQFVNRSVVASQQSYWKWSYVRFGLLAVPFIWNILLYSFAANESAGYLALMSLVSFILAWPSEERMASECAPAPDSES